MDSGGLMGRAFYDDNFDSSSSPGLVYAFQHEERFELHGELKAALQKGAHATVACLALAAANHEVENMIPAQAGLRLLSSRREEIKMCLLREAQQHPAALHGVLELLNVMTPPILVQAVAKAVFEHALVFSTAVPTPALMLALVARWTALNIAASLMKAAPGPIVRKRRGTTPELKLLVMERMDLLLSRACVMSSQERVGSPAEWQIVLDLLYDVFLVGSAGEHGTPRFQAFGSTLERFRQVVVPSGQPMLLVLDTRSAGLSAFAANEEALCVETVPTRLLGSPKAEVATLGFAAGESASETESGFGSGGLETLSARQPSVTETASSVEFGEGSGSATSCEFQKVSRDQIVKANAQDEDEDRKEEKETEAASEQKRFGVGSLTPCGSSAAVEAAAAGDAAGLQTSPPTEFVDKSAGAPVCLRFCGSVSLPTALYAGTWLMTAD